jgi:hypothetical protein
MKSYIRIWRLSLSSTIATIDLFERLSCTRFCVEKYFNLKTVGEENSTRGVSQVFLIIKGFIDNKREWMKSILHFTECKDW